MITLRVWFVMIAISVALTGSSLWSAVRAGTFSSTIPVTAIDGLADQLGAAGAEPRIDVYGNEIQDAVGDYRLDRRGDVYENHSPTTEVTHLKAPST